jgi:hypothetical protein
LELPPTGRGSASWDAVGSIDVPALLVLLGRRPGDWQSDDEFVSSVKTTLSKLGVADSARILHHAYVLATMNLHLFLDYPLSDVPPLTEFEELCSE